MANLLIVESPAKAKTIKKYLGNNFKVVASMGHVRDLPKSKLGIDVENDFTPQYITIRGKSKLITELKKEANNAKKVFLATDPDREGEAISWHLAAILGINPTDNVRVTFNEITKSAVTQGVASPRKINMDLVNAQQARRVLDRLVGYTISPILWKKIRKGLSAGRVQSVATKLIVDRENEINEFVPQEYWRIVLKLNKQLSEQFSASFYGIDGKKVNLKNKEQVDSVLSAIKNAPVSVDDIKTSRKSKNPLPPFITSTLQQDASRILNMTSKRTMQIAQTLYEGVEIPGVGSTGLITYMRTDSLRIAEDAIKEARGYISTKYGDEYLPKSARYYKTKSGAQDAHEAIRPTSMQYAPDVIRKNLTNDQYRLYKLVWDRFTASQMASQVYDTVTADIKAVSDKKYVFKATGSTVVFAGYSAVYADSKPEKNDDDNQQTGKLPVLEVGDNLTVCETLPEQKFTQPPSRYTEASLIKTLEENGIGRPSTYAPTISTILQREYVVKEGKLFKPTNLGLATNEFMCEHFKDIVNTEFTANMENDLDKVETGAADWVSIIRGFNKGFDESINLVKNDESLGRIKVADEESDEICELCGKRMVVKSGRFGKFLACPNYPECKNTKPITHKTGAKCPKCDGEILVKFSKNGNKYYGCSNAPKCDFMSWYEPTDKKCELCGSTLLKKYGFKGKHTLICSNENCTGNKIEVNKK